MLHLLRISFFLSEKLHKFNIDKFVFSLKAQTFVKFIHSVRIIVYI